MDCPKLQGSFPDDELNAYHECTYASRMKILAAIEGKMMDVALMNQEAHFGLDLSGTGLIRQAGFENTVYLGIIANSPRVDTVMEYLRYLTAEEDF